MNRTGIAVSVLAATLVLVSCGSDPSANDRVPALGAVLAEVQESLAAGETDRAQTQLRTLVARTTAARDAGDLSEARAREILAAAATLLAAMPQVSPTPTPPPTESENADDDGGKKDDKKDDEKDDKKGDDKGDDKGKGKGDD